MKDHDKDHDETVALTYDELAAARSITRKAARALAARKRWHRSKGNDRKVRVMVPVRDLDAAPMGDPNAVPIAVPGTAPIAAPIAAPMGIPSGEAEPDLRADLEEARVALAGVRAALDAERSRSAELVGERDRLALDRDRWADLAGELRGDLEAERRAARRGPIGRLFGRAAEQFAVSIRALSAHPLGPFGPTLPGAMYKCAVHPEGFPESPLADATGSAPVRPFAPDLRAPFEPDDRSQVGHWHDANGRGERPNGPPSRRAIVRPFDRSERAVCVPPGRAVSDVAPSDV